MEAVECGAACLAMILAYHGRWVPLEKLREECGVSRDGSKASNLLKVARQYGLTATGYKADLDNLRQHPLPMILFWNFSHFVVLEGFSGDAFFLNDPASGPRTVAVDEFSGAFTGVVLTFEKGPLFISGGEKPRFLPALRRRFKDAAGPMTYVLLAGFFLVLPGLVIPAFSRIFVDQVLVARLVDWQRPLLIGLLLAGALCGGLTWLQSRYLLRFETRLAVTASARFLNHLFRLPIAFFAQRYAGDLTRRVQLNDTVAQFLSHELTANTIGVFLIVFYASVMAVYDIGMTVVAVGIALVNLAVLQGVLRKCDDLNQRLLQDLGKFYGSTMSGIGMIETLKATGSENDFFAQWSGHQAKLVNGRQSVGIIALLLGVAPPFLMALATIAVLFIGGLQVMNGRLSVGMLVAFQALLIGLLTPVNQLVGLGQRLQSMRGNIVRLDDVLFYPQTPVPKAGTDSASAPHALSGRIEMKNVTFGYSRLEPPLIEDFCLRLEPGDRVALVGGSGSGKSTLSKLLAGLYEPWSGEILFDGFSRHEIPRQILTNGLALVDQHILLFEGTIRDNLTLWDATVQEEDILHAAADACIHEDIAARQHGYSGTVAEGGSNFSGGQRQRLEIARALAKNPAVIVLDEATSALDAATEQQVSERLRRRGCSCVIVAHRLSTIRDCDEIIVLDRGKVAERGTHEELMRQAGVYANLIRTT
jgi:NHLM bacteriocin system ABC transporter peptidase/ATP-binding protein